MGGSASPASQRRRQKSILRIFCLMHSISTPDTQRNILANTAKTTRDLSHARDTQRQHYTNRNTERTSNHRCHHKGKTPRGIAQGARPDASHGARWAALKKCKAHPCYTWPSDPLPKTRQQTTPNRKQNLLQPATYTSSPHLHYLQKTTFRYP